MDREKIIKYVIINELNSFKEISNIDHLNIRVIVYFFKKIIMCCANVLNLTINEEIAVEDWEEE